MNPPIFSLSVSGSPIELIVDWHDHTTIKLDVYRVVYDGTKQKLNQKVGRLSYSKGDSFTFHEKGIYRVIPVRGKMKDLVDLDFYTETANCE